MSYADVVLAKSPALYWPAGESSGTVAADDSGNSFDGEYIGSPSLGEPGFTYGVTAVAFDGTDDRIVREGLGDIITAATGLSLEIWIDAATPPAGYSYLCAVDGDKYFYLDMDPTGLLTVGTNVSGGFVGSPGVTVAADGEPHHAVATWDDATETIALILDGVQEMSFDPIGPASAPDFTSAGVGAWPDPPGTTDGPIPARLGQFAVYPYALTEAQAAENYAAGIAPGPPEVETEVNRDNAIIFDNFATARWEPTVIEPTVIEPQNRVVALAYSEPTIDDTQLILDVTEFEEPAHRDRIIVGGIDITYFRGAPTPTPSWQYVMPLGWAAGSFSLPQAVVPFETPGVGALSFLKKFAPVTVQRIDTSDNSVVRTDYRGFVLAHSISGGELVIEIAGHGVGRAALQDRQMMLIQQRFDAGAHVRRALEAMRVRCSPPRGAVTGINLIRWGGGGLLDYFNELVAKMVTVDGDQYTVMPTDDAVYVTALKDLDTIHGTIYLDDARIKGNLRSDASEEPNRIFSSCITPDGMAFKNGAYPGLIQGTAAPYPMVDNSSFGIGTVDADTDTGDGVTVMIWQLRSRGFVDIAHPLNSYDAEASEGIKALQRRARLSVTGTMTTNTWKALFNLSVTGHNLANIRILPVAEDPRVQPYRLSSNGSIIARNPAYDPSVIPADRTIAMGSGFTPQQVRHWGRGELVTTSQWRGEIEINTGAIVAGEHEQGEPITALLRSRDIRPGMNFLVQPLNIVVHTAGVSVDGNAEVPNGKVTLVVDTRPGDTMPVWAAIQRDRDNRNTVHRSFNAQRKSSTFDRENTFDEVGGTISPVALNANNWKVFPVVAKQAGTIEKIALRLSPEREFVMAVFGRKISEARLRRVTNAPLSSAGKARWTEEAVHDALDRDYVLLYVAGSDDDPLGYSPGRKSDGASLLTGRWEDDMPWPFVTYLNDIDRSSVLYVAIWVGASATVHGGRIMWPSAEEY